MKQRKGPAKAATPEPDKFELATYLANPGPGRAIINVRAKGAILSQGDACNAIYYLQKGRVALTVTSQSGKEATIALLSPGDFLGEEAANSLVCFRPATATAITACAALKIDRAEFMRVLNEQRSFSDLFVAFLLSRTMRIQDDLIDQLFNSSEKRLARVLLLLAQFGKRGDPQPLLPEISQRTLAEMVGTTRPRVSFFMNRFRQLGYIEYNGRIKVHKSLLSVLLQD